MLIMPSVGSSDQERKIAIVLAALGITPSMSSSVFSLHMSSDERATTFVKYLETAAKLPVGQSDIPIRNVKEVFTMAIDNNKAAKLSVAEQNNLIISDLQLDKCLACVGKTESIIKRLSSVNDV